MEYETKNRGALFKNADKTKPTDRDYGGTIDVDGTAYWISGWIKTSKKGTSFLSLSIKVKDGETKAKSSFNDPLPMW